jgi:hypothetical protein
MSEIEQSVRLEGHPSIVATPDVEMGNGAGSVIIMPETTDPGLKPYVLSPNAAPLQQIYLSIQNRVAAIDKMANTGGVRSTATTLASGVALETEFQLLNARLSEKADNLELAEEHVWNLWSLYEQQTGLVTVDYPDSFNIRDLGREIDQMKTIADTAQDLRVRGYVDRRLMSLMDLDPDLLDQPAPAPVTELNLEPHPVTTTETRTAHIQQMIMEGYEDRQILAIHAEITQADIDAARLALLTQGE